MQIWHSNLAFCKLQYIVYRLTLCDPTTLGQHLIFLTGPPGNAPWLSAKRPRARCLSRLPRTQTFCPVGSTDSTRGLRPAAQVVCEARAKWRDGRRARRDLGGVQGIVYMFGVVNLVALLLLNCYKERGEDSSEGSGNF